MHGICVFNDSGTRFKNFTWWFILLHRYECTGRVLTVRSASHLLDTGNYCCEVESESGGNESTVCIDVHVAIGGELLQTYLHIYIYIYISEGQWERKGE